MSRFTIKFKIYENIYNVSSNEVLLKIKDTKDLKKLINFLEDNYDSYFKAKLKNRD